MYFRHGVIYESDKEKDLGNFLYWGVINRDWNAMCYNASDYVSHWTDIMMIELYSRKCLCHLKPLENLVNILQTSDNHTSIYNSIQHRYM